MFLDKISREPTVAKGTGILDEDSKVNDYENWFKLYVHTLTNTRTKVKNKIMHIGKV